MEVDFKPDFEGSDVTLLAYALLPGTDAPFPGMDDNACHWMNCPVVKDTTQTYTFNLTMSRDYPAVSFESKSRLNSNFIPLLFQGMFNVRWLMKLAGEPKCCFQNKFKIV
jgi:hypothetical protein